MEFRYQLEGGASLPPVGVEPQGDEYRVTIGEKTYLVAVIHAGDGELTFSINGQCYRVHLARDGLKRYLALGGEAYTLLKTAISGRRATPEAGRDPVATMHGQVVSVLAAEGQAVTRGQPLAVLEAMKMEIRIAAPHDGHVVRVLCAPGQVVERGQPLFELSDR